MSDLLASLSPKRRKFVRKYIENGGNATKAYVDAGYSKNGADRNAHNLMRIHEVGIAVAAARAETEITLARKSVSDMLELEEHFTSEVRGDAYFARIARLERRLEQKEKALAALEAAAAIPNLDPVQQAMLSAKILEATERIFENEATIAQIHIQGRAESNKAGVTLLKLKGAFESKRNPIDDPVKVLNDVARSMLRANVKPSQLLETMRSQARDAEFSVGTGRTSPDGAETPAGGEGGVRRHHLFSRTPPKGPTP